MAEASRGVRAAEASRSVRVAEASRSGMELRVSSTGTLACAWKASCSSSSRLSWRLSFLQEKTRRTRKRKIYHLGFTSWGLAPPTGRGGTEEDEEDEGNRKGEEEERESKEKRKRDRDKVRKRKTRSARDFD